MPVWPKKAFKTSSGYPVINSDATQRLLKSKGSGVPLKWELNSFPAKDAVKTGMVRS